MTNIEKKEPNLLDTSSQEPDVGLAEGKTLAAKDLLIEELKAENKKLADANKSGAEIKSEIIKNLQTHKQKITGEVAKSKTFITMEPNDAKHCHAINNKVFLAKVNGFEYIFKTGIKTQVHPKHEYKLKVMLGKIVPKENIIPEMEYDKEG